MNKSNELKRMIAARTGLFKSYIRGISVAEVRPIKNHVCGWVERDYNFYYRGKAYRVNEYICANDKGEVKYSSKFRYELVEV